MRFWRFWLNTFVLYSQYNPPQFVELLMLMVALAMLAISTFIPTQKAYMICIPSIIRGKQKTVLPRVAKLKSDCFFSNELSKSANLT